MFNSRKNFSQKTFHKKPLQKKAAPFPYSDKRITEIKHLLNLNDRQKKILAYLLRTFPECFSLKVPKPLKVNIYKDILPRIAADLGVSTSESKSSLFFLLRKYTHQKEYFMQLATVSHRVNLDGSDATEITKQEKQYAIAKVALAEKYAAQKSKPKTENNNNKGDFKHATHNKPQTV